MTGKRIFVAGAAGAIGRQLTPMLVEAGHRVTGTTRSVEKTEWLRSVGAEPAMLDVYDAEAIRQAFREAQPEVVIHQLTDLAAGFGPKELALNARLRRIGTQHLVTAAVASGARRFIAQSIAWFYAPGPEPHGESDPLRDPSGDVAEDEVLAGVRELERLVTQTDGFEGIVLRYGFFYGPGTASDAPPRPPRVEIQEAARAAVLAIDLGRPGIYNVVEDEGPVSNRKAKDELGWRPSPGMGEG